jgi:hypothetical protein
MTAKAKAQKRKIDYVAKLDGIVVGRRTTHVAYTHALVVQYDEQAARQEAYAAFDPETLEWLRKEFDIECAAAKCQDGDLSPRWLSRPNNRSRLRYITAYGIESAKKEIVGGFKGYCARYRQLKIDQFERLKREGYFQPKVQGWRQQDDRRDEYPAEEWKERQLVFARYVPAESAEAFSVAKSFAKLSKTTQRAILADICDKMIARKAWDEIAAFLVGQLGPDSAQTALTIVRGL